MKEKALFCFLLMCMLASTLLMLVVLNSINSVRDHSSRSGPGAFNSIMQIDRSLHNYTETLEEYRFNFDNADLRESLRKKYQAQFDIIWGNLEYFNLRSPNESSGISADRNDAALLNFKHDARQFLQSTDALMQTDVILTKDQVSALLDELDMILKTHHDLSQGYFTSAIAYHDSWVNNLNKLHNLLYFFSAALIAAAALLTALLVRSNARKNALVAETDAARTKLRSTVEELRSGKLEQRAKDSFIAAASHDLSQPLHALGLFLNSLEHHVHDAKGKQTLNEAVQCSNNLGELFRSLLDMSRLDAGIVEVRKIHFNLKELLSMLEHEFQLKSQELDIKLEFSADNVVTYSDPILLSRIVRNLIENALVHSNAELIRVVCTPSASGYQLSVEDNGRGISSNEQQMIFSEFYQVRNKTPSANNGLGLGLSIVHRLAELLDMDILLESEKGVATKFSLNVPRGDSGKVLASQNSTSQENLTLPDQDIVVAVVDDDPSICSAMSLMLGNMGLNAVTATTTDSLIDKLIESKHLPDLIVADYRLSKGQTGDQAIVQLKRALNIEVPAILITGDTSPLHVAHAAKSGFELLHKPIEPTELSEKLTQMLLKSIQPSPGRVRSSAPVNDKSANFG